MVADIEAMVNAVVEYHVSILVDVGVQPIMHDYIPAPVVTGEGGTVPPVFVEETVTKLEHLSPRIQPEVKDRKEA